MHHAVVIMVPDPNQDNISTVLSEPGLARQFPMASCKILLLVFICLNGLGPSYLSDLLLPDWPPCTLRSSGTGLLLIPQVSSKKHGEAAFSCYGLRLWDSLPENLRVAETVKVFKKRLKTRLSTRLLIDFFNSLSFLLCCVSPSICIFYPVFLF